MLREGARVQAALICGSVTHCGEVEEMALFVSTLDTFTTCEQYLFQVQMIALIYRFGG